MSRHSDEVRLRHMLDYASEAVAMVHGKKRADLEKSRLLQLGLVRLVEIVGEAAARVSPEGRGKYPSLPWSDIIGMRNRLVHGYDDVDINILWDTIADDLPGLVIELGKILPKDANGKG